MFYVVFEITPYDRRRAGLVRRATPMLNAAMPRAGLTFRRRQGIVSSVPTCDGLIRYETRPVTLLAYTPEGWGQ
jgi:hypothetical protein